MKGSRHIPIEGGILDPQFSYETPIFPESRILLGCTQQEIPKKKTQKTP